MTSGPLSLIRCNTGALMWALWLDGDKRMFVTRASQGLSFDFMVVDLHTCLPTGRWRPQRQKPHVLRGMPVVIKSLWSQRVAGHQQQWPLSLDQILPTRSLTESPPQLYEGNTIIMLQTGWGCGAEAHRGSVTGLSWHQPSAGE